MTALGPAIAALAGKPSPLLKHNDSVSVLTDMPLRLLFSATAVLVSRASSVELENCSYVPSSPEAYYAYSQSQ